ncbi:MAG TPA: hypothetical protein PKW07_05050 [Syntrophorhabdaceae bacterium]|nr:hypothetical protein [Syntrophorhabdaceae bacterium]
MNLFNEKQDIHHAASLNIHLILNKAQIQINKIEGQWEMDHNQLTIRDDLHLMRLYLRIIAEYMKKNQI